MVILHVSATFFILWSTVRDIDFFFRLRLSFAFFTPFAFFRNILATVTTTALDELD